MKFRNNLIYYIEEKYKSEQREQDVQTKCDKYKEELRILKQVCEDMGITTSDQMKMLISNLEKELDGVFSITEKRIGSIFISTVFAGCAVPMLSEYLGKTFEMSVLILLGLFEIFLVLTGVSLGVAMLNDNFGSKGKRKKLLKMLYDINLLYYSEKDMQNM